MLFLLHFRYTFPGMRRPLRPFCAFWNGIHGLLTRLRPRRFAGLRSGCGLQSAGHGARLGSSLSGRAVHRDPICFTRIDQLGPRFLTAILVFSALWNLLMSQILQVSP